MLSFNLKFVPPILSVKKKVKAGDNFVTMYSEGGGVEEIENITQNLIKFHQFSFASN